MRLNPYHATPSTILATLSGLAATAALSLTGCESVQSIDSTNPGAGEYAVVSGDRIDVPDIDMGNSRTINRIINEGRDHSQVMDILRVYTVDYGPRLTGSTRLHASQRWAVDQLNSWGLSNVELQEFGTIATRFDRGPSTGKVFISDADEESGRKELRNLEFSTLSWSPGTDGPVSGHIATLPTTMSEYESQRGTFGGA